MTDRKLVVTAVQETFLQMVVFQLKAVFGDRIQIRPVRFDNLFKSPPEPDETVFTFLVRVIEMLQDRLPYPCEFLVGKRSLNLFNLGPLMDLEGARRILVVNDNRGNTDATLAELKRHDSRHEYIPYYPGEPIPGEIDLTITAGEEGMVPQEAGRVIDIGLRVVNPETIFSISDYFHLDYLPGQLTDLYMKSLLRLAKEWPALGQDRYITSWTGTQNDIKARQRFQDLVARSPAMHQLVAQAEMMATRDEPIHLYGELGTGKIRIAQAIHNGSRFKVGPFASINCSARTPDMLEKELFGWEEEGAIYPGLFETTRGGSLCIVEVGGISPQLQPKIVQAISERKIVRVNGVFFVDIDVRIITTSSERLDTLNDARFHRGLYLLLTQLTCRVPSLSERIEDFEGLVHAYLVGHLNQPDLKLSKETLGILKRHRWQGNVQELYNVLLHMAFSAHGTVGPEYLPFYITRQTAAAGPADSSKADVVPEAIIADIEKTGFLDESLLILSVYLEGKRRNTSYGRGLVHEKLGEKGLALSWQQLRLRLERLDQLGLLNVRMGRAGTTISRKGERFLDKMTPQN
ncbi:MAG: sigma-54-dependent Fis family transcriptional regulator [Desulfobacteraceae bacterium]|nr:sigma-54-dependent Fis family transcriptional regulator [Desulfobacteraceae bacterium]